MIKYQLENDEVSFYNIIGALHNITRQSDKQLLAKLNQLADKEGNISLTPQKRNTLCLELNTNKPNFAVERCIAYSFLVISP